MDKDSEGEGKFLERAQVEKRSLLSHKTGGKEVGRVSRQENRKSEIKMNSQQRSRLSLTPGTEGIELTSWKYRGDETTGNKAGGASSLSKMKRFAGATNGSGHFVLLLHLSRETNLYKGKSGDFLLHCLMMLSKCQVVLLLFVYFIFVRNTQNYWKLQHIHPGVVMYLFFIKVGFFFHNPDLLGP